MIPALMCSLSLLATTPQPAPLLANGTTLTGVPGVMVRPQPDDPWTLRLTGDATDPNGRVQDFVLMPCRMLEEMEELQESNQTPPVFVVTGEVTVFAGRNWLMPAHVEQSTEATQRSMPTTPPPDPGQLEEDEMVDDGMAPGVAAGDSIADIVANLQQRVPRVARSIDEGGDRNISNASMDRQLIVSRRGRLLRNQNGAWMFIFDADAWGTGDPPAVLLPSPMLQQLVAAGRSGDYRRPIHLSGTLSTYRGRRFIVPTAISPFYERPNLSR